MELILKKFKDIKKEWVVLYKQTPEVSPFLEPSTFVIAWKYFYPYYLVERSRPVIAQFVEKGETVALIPLTVHRNFARLFGAPNGFNESGALYRDAAVLPRCAEMLKEHFMRVEFIKIDERSPMATLRPECCRECTNVAIHFGNNFDTYFKSLSSSVRQNIRTAYNRLVKDMHTIDLQVFVGGGQELPVRDIIDLYCNRHSNRYGVKTSLIKKWFLRNQSFATRIYKQSANALTFYLTIDNVPAAFMSGVWNKDRLIVPRLSINNQFRRYSPGLILVCESIKYMITKTSIENLDLSQGEEPYKFQLGGKVHLSYSFEL